MTNPRGAHYTARTGARAGRSVLQLPGGRYTGRYLKRTHGRQRIQAVESQPAPHTGGTEKDSNRE